MFGCRTRFVAPWWWHFVLAMAGHDASSVRFFFAARRVVLSSRAVGVVRADVQSDAPPTRLFVSHRGAALTCMPDLTCFSFFSGQVLSRAAQSIHLLNSKCIACARRAEQVWLSLACTLLVVQCTVGGVQKVRRWLDRIHRAPSTEKKV